MLSSKWFPLVQLPKKFKDDLANWQQQSATAFPLVQLPKKFKVFCSAICVFRSNCVSISSTSEEVQRGDGVCTTAETVNRFPLVQLPKKFKGHNFGGQIRVIDDGFH